MYTLKNTKLSPIVLGKPITNLSAQTFFLNLSKRYLYRYRPINFHPFLLILLLTIDPSHSFKCLFYLCLASIILYLLFVSWAHALSLSLSLSLSVSLSLSLSLVILFSLARRIIDSDASCLIRLFRRQFKQLLRRYQPVYILVFYKLYLGIWLFWKQNSTQEVFIRPIQHAGLQLTVHAVLAANIILC